MKSVFFICLIVVAASVKANDGSFYVSGNHLIPMIETRIAVKKEILSIKKISKELAEINVYYEFFNPDGDRDLLVGFEAQSPGGDVNGKPVNGHHPYLYDFSVQLNNRSLSYQVALVTDSVYYKNGKIISHKEADLVTADFDPNSPGFNYVYHFNARFVKGKNIIKHRYLFQLSGSVEDDYSISYVLTAAKRWANKKIDDFTLLIDMGNYQDFYLQQGFFSSGSDWTITGPGKILEKQTPHNYLTGKYTRFIVQNGILYFTKNNFSPNGELELIKPRFTENAGIEVFNYKEHRLPMHCGDYVATQTADATSKQILRNLPYAIRGYVFTNPEIKKYYEKMDWYIPNAGYEPNPEMLLPEEREWLQQLK